MSELETQPAERDVFDEADVSKNINGTGEEGTPFDDTKRIDERTDDSKRTDDGKRTDGSEETEKEVPAEILDEEDVTFSDEVVNRLLKKGLKQPDSRPHLNVVFIGHVDAGKSTTCGNILFLTGQVDSRTIEKYEREAKEKNRDTWYLAYIMDVNEEERIKGKTVEVGRATFELQKVRYTILDAPGHKGFVPEMLSGASQADLGVLIISARKGEFEAGFERGGQTREHALLAKTLGVNQLIVAVNKMDEATVEWSEERYKGICSKLAPFLKTCGFNPSRDIQWIPISGQLGQNIKDHVSDPKSPQYDARAAWYDTSKPTLFELFEHIECPKRDKNGPLRIPLLTGFKDNGIIAIGKVESGVAMVDQPAVLLPQNVKIKILGVRSNEEDYAYANPGENVELRLIGCEEDALKKGSMISSIKTMCPVVTLIEAQIVIVELLEHRPILTCGYKCIFHIHTLTEEIELEKILSSQSTKSKTIKKVNPPFIKQDMMAICHLKFMSPACVESFTDRPQLGRFTLRDEGRTIAIGKVTKILA